MKKPDFKAVKQLIRDLEKRAGDVRFILDDRVNAEEEVEEECRKILGIKALDLMETISVEELKNSKAGIRTGALTEAGYTNLLQLARLKDWELTAIPGIGEKQALAIRNLITDFINEMAKHVHLKFSLEKDENGEVPNASLLLALAKLYRGNGIREDVAGIAQEIEQAVSDAKVRIEIKNGVHWLFSPKDAKERTVKAIKDLNDFSLGKTCCAAGDCVQVYRRTLEMSMEDALADFEKYGADYYALLERHGGAAKENPLIYSSIPAQLAAEIEESPIDLSRFRGNLRSYQLFGAKYVLFERRVLLGDEMGLGKTVQAIAAMCDVRARVPESLFLVICPASVLINWCREIEKFSDMKTYLLRGSFLDEKFESWCEGGGVAVTNFETMEKIVWKIDGKLRIAMLVIDEAHYIKNPDAKRTQNVRALDEESDRILMMTGTPLENRVEEMCSLIEFIRPDMVEEVRKNAFMSHAAEFRELLAPVYLRRQRDQVLEELPPIEETFEWCELSAQDYEDYSGAVRERSFNSMRRVGFLCENPETSSKVRRLCEICKDATEDGRKIMIYSFFLETIDRVQKILGEQCIGTITGSTPVMERQGLIDALAAAPAGSAVVCQIQAGGTGLNVQAASVVIFCEPQIKPSLTKQAISRVYRMGQVRNVLVRHLLCANTVDEAMTVMLERKQKEFDAYADESALADALDNLVDKDWIQKLIEEENRKYSEGGEGRENREEGHEQKE